MKKIVLLTIFFFSVMAGAQNVLTINNAIDMAMKKNFDIKVMRSQADISKINNTPGNAGMLPTVGLNGSGSVGYNNVHQKLSSGTVNNYSSQLVTSVGAGVEMSWTLFDGGRMYATKNKLAQLQALGELQFNEQVLQTIYNVVAAYYDIVCQKQQLETILKVIGYNTQRVLIARTGFNAGTLAKTELLQANIDLNVAKEDSISQQYAISETKKNLNFLLGQDISTPIEVSESIPASAVPGKNDMLLKIESSNASLLALQKQIDVSKLVIKEAERWYRPTFNLQGGSSVALSHYSQGGTKSNRTFGPEIGGTLSIPLYTAGESKRKIAVARTEQLIAQYNLDNTRLQITKELLSAYDDFENQQKMLQIERDNNRMASENMEICLQRLRLGQTTSLEVHQAQESFAQSSARLINFEYNLKIKETKLKQLVSDLN